MGILDSLDLISVGLTVVAILTLGFVIFLKQKDSVTNRWFLFFSATTSLWSIANYFSYNITDPTWALFTLRVAISLAVLHAFSFAVLFFVFPKQQVKIKKSYVAGLAIWTFFVMILALSPWVFSGVSTLTSGGAIRGIEVGPAIPIFALTIVSYIFGGVFFLIKKTRKAIGVLRKQIGAIAIGTIATFGLLIVLNFILPTFFDISKYVAFGAITMIPLVFAFGYSIIRFGLFNIKIILTQIFVFLLWVFMLFRALLYQSAEDFVVSAILFIFMVVLGSFLMKSVIKEVKQREQLQKLTIQLGKANEKLQEIDQMKTEFLSLASHQLRTPLTAIKGYSSMILEGNFGKITKKASEPIEKIFQSSVNLAEVISDLLDVSKIEQGGMQYAMRTFSLEPLVQSVVDEQKLAAKEKGIILEFHADPGHKYAVKGDKLKLRQVFQNLVDNAIKYTPKGSVKVSLGYTKDRHVRIDIKDTGLGIAPDGIEKLFQKFSRGTAAKVNTGGSGLGLYLVMQIVKAHAGKVWIESEGEGKGATFIVELPTLYN